MKKFILRFTKSKWSKVLACALICSVFISLFAISSSAALVFDTVSFSFNFPGARASVTGFWQQTGGNIVFYDRGVTYFSNVNLNEYSSLLTVTSGSEGIRYFLALYIGSNYSSITVNGVSISGSLSYSPPITTLAYSENYSYVFTSEESSSDTTYFYELLIPAYNFDDYNEYYLQGYQDGINSQEAKNKWYPEGYDAGYTQGEQDGLNSSGSSALGQNLIGDTLSAPFRALNEFIIYTTPGGREISLGFIFGGLIAFTFFMAFLKMFAGG